MIESALNSRTELLLAAIRRLDGDLESDAVLLGKQLAEASAECQTLRRHDAKAQQQFKAAVQNPSAHATILGTADAATEAAAQLAVMEERCRDLSARHADVEQKRQQLGPLMAFGMADRDADIAPTSTSHHLFSVVEEERMRIARDMHDGPAQSLANLVLQAEVVERLFRRDPSLLAEELTDFKGAVREVLAEMRGLIFDLRPMTLDDLGLVPTLRTFIAGYEERTELPVALHVSGEERRLPSDTEAALFRITQEALTNVYRHARAHSIDVTVIFHRQHVTLSVKDDGEGFDVMAAEAKPLPSQHLGLVSMRERAELQRGTLAIVSSPGRGTEIRVTIDV